MGRAKEHWMELQQQKEDTKLAERLGITYDELCETDWHMEAEESRDGLLYGYVVYFHHGPKEILKKIKGLNSDNQVWFSPFDFDDDEYYDYEDQYITILSNKLYYDSFVREIHHIQELNKLELDDKNLELVLKRQLYVAIIGTLETFLSETFINQIDENSTYFRNFVETFPQFAKQKFQLNEIFKEYEKIKKTVQKSVLEVIYHNLDKVENMYVATFGIEFPNIDKLSKAVSIRHDFVHRNGKTKEGIEVTITSEINKDLIAKVIGFVEEIADKLALKDQASS
jgi:hypothetical protein